MTQNLNKDPIINDDWQYKDGTPAKNSFFDYSTLSANKDTEVYFRDLKEHLIKKIHAADIILGCVAWLTDFDILRALSEKEVSIVVQKEDFLRPDAGTNRDNSLWKKRLQAAYMKVGTRIERWQFLGCNVHNLSMGGDPVLDGIRCAGNHNKDRNPSFPRMHNKFLVFGKEIPLDKEPVVVPNITDSSDPFAGFMRGDINDCDLPKRPFDLTSVWTGSFNLSKNAGYSLENAVVISDEKIAQAYYGEWGQIVAISEPLDWESEWIAPQWRIGT